MSNRIDQLRAHSPDQALALGVLEQAIRDVLTGPTYYCLSAEVAEARAFLTSPVGEWRKARRVWCDQAGIDPDYFERRMQVLMEAGKI